MCSYARIYEESLKIKIIICALKLSIGFWAVLDGAKIEEKMCLVCTDPVLLKFDLNLTEPHCDAEAFVMIQGMVDSLKENNQRVLRSRPQPQVL
jgi:hypothetical protein